MTVQVQSHIPMNGAGPGRMPARAHHAAEQSLQQILTGVHFTIFRTVTSGMLK